MSSESSSNRRELRPRQAAESRAAPAGVTTPRAAPTRVTRSSAGTQANPRGAISAPPPQPRISTRSSTRANRSHSNKRAVSPTPLSVGTRQSKRSRPQSGFYDEDSDSDLGLDLDLDLDLDNASSASPQSPVADPQPTTPRRSTPRTPRSAAKTAKKRPARSHQFTPLKSQTATEEAPAEPAIIPDWLSLPYFVLVQIFQYASAPLNDQDSVSWLLATSRVCRTFLEPALTALYQCPPLLTRPMAHNLVTLLARDPSTTKFNYRVKVEKLRIDVEEIAAKAFRGQQLDLKTLITSLPRLKVLDFSHPLDLPPYRRLDDNLRWHYPDALFEALNGTPPSGGAVDGIPPTKLTGWRWNRRMMEPDMDLAQIRSLHLKPAFASLKKLCFINYQVPSLKARRPEDAEEALAQDRAFVQSFADAISALPDLEYLSIESSTVVNEDLLACLPESIKTLELLNCWEVFSEEFASYLLSRGHKLEHLSLHHNQSLNLGFLSVLGTACPNLQTLSVDLKNFNHHEFYHDSDPNYEDVLTVDQIPKWPESLEIIEMRNMRKWTAEAAEVFFQSLVDSAPRLPKLRHLALKAMLDIPFRQRSAIRDKWAAKLKRVFLRKQVDPRPFFTLRPKPNRDEEKAKKAAAKTRAAAKLSGTANSASRRSNRLAEQFSNPSSRSSSVGRDLRQARAKPSYVEPDTDVEVSEADEESADESRPSSAPTPASQDTQAESDFFRHGMCESVDIQLDNQKPRERTWQMEDFMDENASDDLSDEDWSGDREDVAGYAW
ncbi:hypothetical protein B0H67DRAFT_649497 [Lasiosphaeris hirsuta]|uniref:F-box domain-containing protein n=1 Tax=Lasiosphaeris hirsuta TaxID=260670 RepID=A0AA39ZWZ1_9PEZI|nr:hypothetical protein B0H67DRAFT_649497 [Lasiosphaeris hirsuta]